MKAKQLRDLNDVIKIQQSHGNWNYDQYMHGMLNGLLLARSIITNTDAEFVEAPRRWLYKKTLRQKFILWWLRFTNQDVSNKVVAGAINTKIKD